MDGFFGGGLLPLETVACDVCETEPPRPDKGLPAPLIPGEGTFFDEYIELRDAEGAVFTERVLEIYDQNRPMMRKKGREALTQRTRALLANAMRVQLFRESAAVLYFRGAASPWYKDSPPWMKHGALADVVDILVRAGLFYAVSGKRMGWRSKKRSWAASYAATDELVRIATECGTSKDSISRRIPPEKLVRLFEPKPKREFDFSNRELVGARKGNLIQFAPTAETQNWTDTLAAINAFYREQDIGLGLGRSKMSAWLSRRSDDPDRVGARYKEPEVFQTDLYRIFNNGDRDDPKFDQGGRLFGGWWMSVPSELRTAIIINGEPTVEIDYSNCHPRMLYHERGLEPKGDLYALPEIADYEAAAGVAPSTYRPYVKWLMQVLINCHGRAGAVRTPNHIVMPPTLTVAQVLRFIELRHHPIAAAFNTGAGMRLMRMESDIALEIITRAAKDGWTALAIHDSFVAPFDRKDRLMELMTGTYFNRLGKKPVFK